MIDPRQPISRSADASQNEPAPHIDEFSPDRNRNPFTIAIVGTFIAVGVIVSAVALNTPTHTPAPASAPAQATPTTPGMPFTMPGSSASTGTWEILEETWSESGVTVKVKIYANTGTIKYAFSLFDNTKMEAVRPSAALKTPELKPGTLTAGQSAEGYVSFSLAREEATLVLASDGVAQQVSALPIRG